ncbi:MAG: LacI family DNA-binding transcriptional regulator [Paracoccaceae bacterium]
MARRPTISDVAREAGVSVATVDRVLNARIKVREDTARRVLEAARRVGYHAAGLIESRLQPEWPRMRFGFVLHKERQAFYQRFHQEIEAAVRNATGVHASAVIRYSPSQSPSDFIELMTGLRGEVDALAATAITHHSVTDAVTGLQEGGIPVFALLNDFAQGVRKSYVGLNNVRVGRIAAWMLGTAARRPGKLAVFVGGHRWHGHELRETGFRSYFREYAPQFEVLDTLVNLETRQLTYEATLDLLARHGDLRGIYVAGGGMEGAIAALREVRQPGDVALVVNELTPESRAALSDRYVAMVISTPLARLCHDMIGLMTGAAQGGLGELAGQYFLQPDLYVPESI